MAAALLCIATTTTTTTTASPSTTTTRRTTTRSTTRAVPPTPLILTDLYGTCVQPQFVSSDVKGAFELQPVSGSSVSRKDDTLGFLKKSKCAGKTCNSISRCKTGMGCYHVSVSKTFCCSLSVSLCLCVSVSLCLSVSLSSLSHSLHEES